EVIVRGEVHRRPTVHEDPSALTPLDAAEAPAEVLVRQLVQLSLEGGPQPRCRAAFDRCPICKAWVRHAVVLVVNPSARARGREGTIRGADALPTASTSGPGSASRSRRGAGAPFAPERTGAQIVDHSLPWSILRPETGRSHSSSTRFRAPPGD